MPRERTQEQIQQLRQMSAEARRDLNISRIADALEEISDELREMNERQRGGHPGEGGNPLLDM
jgi:hypothetical protein